MLDLKYFYIGFIFFTIHISGLLYSKTFFKNGETNILKKNISINKIYNGPVLLRLVAFLCFTLFIKNTVNENVYFILFLLNLLWYINTICIHYKYYKDEYKNNTICDISNILQSLVLLIYSYLFLKLF